MTDEERAAEVERIKALLTGCAPALVGQRSALAKEGWDDGEVVVPDSFSPEVVDGALFLGMPVVRGWVEAPLVRRRVMP